MTTKALTRSARLLATAIVAVNIMAPQFIHSLHPWSRWSLTVILFVCAIVLVREAILERRLNRSGEQKSQIAS